MLKPFLFGSPSRQHVAMAQSATCHPDNMFIALMDKEAMWDPKTMDLIVKEFPPNYIVEADLYLILAECIANATLHGDAEALCIHARQRANVFLLSFFQIPPMLELVPALLSQSHKNRRSDESGLDLPGGLGFPILLRIAHYGTITTDRTRLQLLFRVKNP